MTREPLRAELLLDEQADDALRRDLTAGLAALGLTVARTRTARAHRGPGDLPWLVLLALPVQAFLSGLGAAAVEDSWRALRALVHRAAHRRAPTGGAPLPRPLVLHDQPSGLRIVLEPELPVEAYEQLLALDLTRYRHGPLHYDRALGRWRSELDEAAG
jgi:hypothetical protein